MNENVPFTVDVDHICMFRPYAKGTLLQMKYLDSSGYPAILEVSEDYETVKRRLANFYKPLENISGWPYGE